ncbi:MAG: LysR substrate-binding domain-containing protein [Burkholderiales bacterium]|nr:LysR substrate-binding domain-containing protein [Burkholderiales bacterium]
MIHHWTLQQFRLFEAVARHRSYTRAAEELHLTQPAVHIQVKRLEEGMGLPLIGQARKKLLLTRAGEEVYEAALAVTTRLQALSDTLTDMKGKVAGPLKVAVVTSAKFFMPHFLGRFVQEYPEVHPQLTVTNRARVLERLANNLDDFVVLGQIPEHLALVAQPFLENLLVLAAHPEHPLAKEKNISIKRLANERLLLREPGSGTRSSTERLFAEHELALHPYMELGSGEAIKQAIMANLGVSIVPLGSLELELDARRIAILDVEGFPLHRMWHAVHLGGKRLGLTAATFLEFLVREGTKPVLAPVGAISAKPPNADKLESRKRRGPR